MRVRASDMPHRAGTVGSFRRNTEATVTLSFSSIRPQIELMSALGQQAVSIEVDLSFSQLYETGEILATRGPVLNLVPGGCAAARVCHRCGPANYTRQGRSQQRAKRCLTMASLPSVTTPKVAVTV